ncbi:MAG: peptide chain release factor 1 [Candidatus Marinimicrobia bacterium]|jgi:peptide chain release factor 1|nr:peptide chain release factor 1 [Candidatus Neomarinimicrobiota bacterium]|tara:strand:- start:2410 stop:3477 length:1068 start_codon:yes stop_codon:yes gene_type:complete
MINKLKEIIDHFESLEARMANPELINDQNRYTEVAKEHRRLNPIVEKAREFVFTQKQMDDDLEILNGDDDELKDIAQAEIEQLQETLTELEEELKVLLLPHDPTDDKNTIIEIRAGTGGDEAALFAADLYRMYSRFAERNSWKYEVMESNAIGIGGFKEIIFSVTGEGVYGMMKFESGVHRVQRVPKTETSGRVHTSAATVAVLPEAEEADIEVVDADLKIDTYRASGAGGQHVNKTESAIRITHIPTGLVVTCQDETSQHKNKVAALKVLRSRLLATEQEKLAEKRAAARKDMVSTGDRSAKIRTYNFPQGRITDHRISFTAYNLEGVMDGDINDIIENLKLADQQAQLATVRE